jgi:hypothetical protein
MRAIFEATLNAERADVLDVEERLGATDPYRQLGQLAHLILRKADTAVSP